MSSATIKRETGKGGRRQAPPRPRTRRGARRKSRLERLIDMLPVSAETLSHILTIIIAGLIVTVLWMAAVFFGLPAMAGQQVADMAARAGFQVEKVEVQGVRHMDEMPVYSLALDQVDRSMLSVDLSALRRKVMTLGWVKDARITRRLPDTLVIDIVERDPVAVWQNRGTLSLIDVDGAVLERVDGRSMPDLPLVIGPQANRETKALQGLMEAAPALKPLIAGATWVGNRRWDLRFQSGETLALPEGEGNAATALMKFAQMDGVNRLLGRGILRFDMRDPSRFVLRLPPSSGSEDASGTAQAKVDGTAKSQDNGSDGAAHDEHTETTMFRRAEG